MHDQDSGKEQSKARSEIKCGRASKRRLLAIDRSKIDIDQANTFYWTQTQISLTLLPGPLQNSRRNGLNQVNAVTPK